MLTRKQSQAQIKAIEKQRSRIVNGSNAAKYVVHAKPPQKIELCARKIGFRRG